MDLHRRTIFITLLGGAPWGFRLYGGGGKPLRISKIRRRSKAHQNGLQPGDVLVSVNGAYCSYATHEFAVQLIARCNNGLTLEVQREQDRELVFHNDVADFDFFEEDNEIQYPNQIEIQHPNQTQFENENENENEIQIHVAEVRFVPEDPRIKPASDDVTPVSMERLLKQATPEPIAVLPKKVYGDSTFFNDPSKTFPTIEEEKEMARRVAQALTDVLNSDSRGASMFEKRRQRSAKWVTQAHDDESLPEHVQPSAKSVQLFVEEMKQAPKSKHNVVPPATCFDIAAALHKHDGRGAQIFARRRAKSEKWVVQAREPLQKAQPATPTPSREPLVVSRIGMPPPPPPPPPKPLASRQSTNDNENTVPLHIPQTSLGVNKTFNTQPRGWRLQM